MDNGSDTNRETPSAVRSYDHGRDRQLGPELPALHREPHRRRGGHKTLASAAPSGNRATRRPGRRTGVTVRRERHSTLGMGSQVDKTVCTGTGRGAREWSCTTIR